jgi:hypothetical protein
LLFLGFAVGGSGDDDASFACDFATKVTFSWLFWVDASLLSESLSLDEETAHVNQLWKFSWQLRAAHLLSVTFSSLLSA